MTFNEAMQKFGEFLGNIELTYKDPENDIKYTKEELTVKNKHSDLKVKRHPKDKKEKNEN